MSMSSKISGEWWFYYILFGETLNYDFIENYHAWQWQLILGNMQSTFFFFFLMTKWHAIFKQLFFYSTFHFISIIQVCHL